jgi:hypothetical protein
MPAPPRPKQSELDREIRALTREEAKKHGWKSIDGMLYWALGPLFFVLAPAASAKEGSFYCSLRFKWLELDSVLWKVLGMESNENEPFSLHANGAFVLRGQEVFSVSERGFEWLPGVLAAQLALASQQARERAADVAARAMSIDAYLAFIQRAHEEFMSRNPRAAVDIWKEALLIALMNEDSKTAAEIASARIAAGDSGGYSAGGKSFYERALAYARHGV